MEESLEDRLKSHAQAFNGLLSLIPAERYYEGDKSEQWQRKKPTKDEIRAAKLAKLNPENAKTAKDLIDERQAASVAAGKRKRDGEDDEDDVPVESVADVMPEKPMEGLKPRKKSKRDQAAAEEGLSAEDKTKSRHEKAAAKAEVKQQKNERKKEKQKEKTKAKKDGKASKQDKKSKVGDPEESHDEDEIVEFDGEDLAESSSASPTSKAPSPTFDAPIISGSSSTSSIATQSVAPKKAVAKENPVNHEEIRAKLQAKIAALRLARGAEGTEDRPARSRTELIEQRRKKEEQKKALKKQLRIQMRDEERRQRNEALARNSPLMTPTGAMSPAQASPLSEVGNFSFSRMALDNGQLMSANLTSVLNPHKKSTSAAIAKPTLEALEQRQKRLSGMTPEQRASVEEKDMWLNAKKRAQGERIKDDVSLLKKALKRKDQQKKKSSKEWDERIAGIGKAQAAKQKRREENLAKRKEEKGSKTKSKGGKKGGSKGKGKKKARPGFEGSFGSGSSKRK